MERIEKITRGRKVFLTDDYYIGALVVFTFVNFGCGLLLLSLWKLNLFASQ